MDGIFIAKATAYLSAALAIAFGCFAPAHSQGMVGAKACENIGKYPESYRDIRMTMIIAMGLIETSAIYSLLIAGAIIFFS